MGNTNQKRSSSLTGLEKISIHTTELKSKSSIDFGTQLRNNGHRCVKIQETYPFLVTWCHSNPCELV